LMNPDTAPVYRTLMVPFVKTPVIQDMGLFSVIFMTIVIAGSSNAVNLTDGLDGLAIGCTICVALAFVVISYVTGNYIIAEYLRIPFVKGVGELAVFC